MAVLGPAFANTAVFQAKVALPRVSSAGARLRVRKPAACSLQSCEVAVALLAGGTVRHLRHRRRHRLKGTSAWSSRGCHVLRAADEEVDVVVIGSGIGGLCAAGLLSSYGAKVVVCEAHGAPGGAAHGFTAKLPKSQGGGEFLFDTGPSFFSGLSGDSHSSTNPLRAVLDALGVEVPCHTYSTFGLMLPEGNFVHTPDFATRTLQVVSGNRAVREWEKLLETMKPLAAAVEALPVAALRPDPGVLLSASQFMPRFLTLPGGPFAAASLTQPFSATLDRAGVKDRFARNWLDLLCFCLSGLTTTGTVTAEMAMMFSEFYKPNAVMDYPVGGVRALVKVLTDGLQKHGGELRLLTKVSQVRVEGGRATGVVLSSGKTLGARQAVICGASVWDALKLLPPGAVPRDWAAERQATPPSRSFVHLHVGFDSRGLEDLQAHYVCIQDWERGAQAEENAVLVSIPSVEDKGLAPEGYGVLHAYTPATEPWEPWAGLDRGSEEYKALKHKKAEFIWRQLDKIIPDIRSRAKVNFVGTPLTHQRFLRRHQGSYGPALVAGEASFPGPTTPLPGLVLCGDSCFPGIGVPAVAASGMLAAHATGLNTLGPQLEMLKRILQ